MTSGSYLRTAEHNKKIGLSNKGRVCWMKGQHHSEETKLKISKAIRGRIPWNKNTKGISGLGFTGKHHTEEWKISQSNKLKGTNHPMYGKKQSEEWKRKKSETMKGCVPWNKGKKGLVNVGSFKKGISSWNNGKHHSEETKLKLSLVLKGKKKLPFSEEHKIKLKIARSKRIFPIKDTTIEVKIQSFLKQLNIEFYTHQYINEIEHAYQCDIFIPVQDGIKQKTIIECDGNYWHHYPTGKETDHIRTKELIEKGFKVLRLWENEIKVMDINDLNNKL